MRGGVTDGKRSRLQPSAAGGTGRDGTARDATAPPPPPGGTPPGLRGTDTAPGAAVPPQVTPSPGGAPRSTAAERDAPRRAEKRGPGRPGVRLAVQVEPHFQPRAGTGTRRAPRTESSIYTPPRSEERVTLMCHY